MKRATYPVLFRNVRIFSAVAWISGGTGTVALAAVCCDSFLLVRDSLRLCAQPQDGLLGWRRAPIRALTTLLICLIAQTFPSIAQSGSPTGGSFGTPGPSLEALPKRYYYATENSATGEAVQRGRSSVRGIAQGDIILAPSTRYRHWLYNMDSGQVGFVDFTTPSSGKGFQIPPVPMSLPMTVDTDQDGLPDDAEFIIGTDPSNPDTDGDGIKDGAAIALGLDPGAAARTGVVGTAPTPGFAVDVCAINDIAVVANLNKGISVFNVFNRMSPLIMAQVGTAGTAQRVACSGNLVVVADGPAGVAIIDITDPPAAKVIHQVDVRGTAQAITSAAGVGYAGLANGQLVEIDLASGTVLQRTSLGAPPDDLGIDGDYLFALAGGSIRILPLDDLGLRVVGQVALPTGGRRLSVGGGMAWAVTGAAYTVANVEDPLHPFVFSSFQLPGGGVWRQLVPNGSGLGVAAFAASVGRNQMPGDVDVYDFRDLPSVGRYMTTLGTPGDAQSLAIFNGLAYVADGEAGLQVVNYLAFDTRNIPPAIILTNSFPMTTATNGIVEEGKLVRASALVTDDVQVRNVEFYLDDVKVLTDGSFPFEYRFITPRIAASRASLRLKARASDTGGNATWTETITVTLTPDETPPSVVRFFPPPGSAMESNSVLVAVFDDPVNAARITPGTVQLVWGGPDGVMDTSDDDLMNGGVLEYSAENHAAFLRFPTNLPAGVFRIRVLPPISDLGGNVLAHEFRSHFSIAAQLCDVRPGDCVDTDHDGIPDSVELLLGLDPTRSDSFLDGVPDGARDFDHDGLSNAAELLRGTDPRRSDTDYDGLSDSDEILRYHTNPFSPDTDGDGWPDALEVAMGTNPLDPASRPGLRVTVASSPVAWWNAAPEPGPTSRVVASGIVALLNSEDPGRPSTRVVASGIVALLNTEDPGRPTSGFVATPVVAIENK